MTFRVVVVFFSRTAKLVTLANVIAEGARAVSGADVRVVRAREAREVTSGTNGTSTSYERGILDAEIATPEDVLEADCVLIGAPTRRGIVATEMSAFLERLGDAAAGRGGAAALKGKIAGAFTEVGESGIGGHEMVLMSAHAWFMQHGMIVVGAPPAPMTTESSGVATALGTVIAARESLVTMPGVRELNESEVKLAYAQGEWAAVVAKQLHDDGCE